MIEDKKNEQEQITPQQINVEAQSVAYIKLIKNSKGYNWEIKQLTLNIDELIELNKKMLEHFGSIENG